jgi:putative ABC transport system permease protein
VSWLSGWRLALRLARRDALRSRGRSVLVMGMIALPVLAVTAADVVLQTSEVSGVESLDRRLGTADASVTFQPGVTRVLQSFDPDDASTADGASGDDRVPAGLAAVRRALGHDVHGLAWNRGDVQVETVHGVASVESSQLDLADPLADGIFDVARGRVPRRGDEVVVSTALADRGFALGDELRLDDGTAFTVVGIGESTSYRNRPMLVGTSPELASPEYGYGATWLIDGGSVSWDQVRAVNRVGGLVLSRAVLLDPPPDSEIPAEIRGYSSVDEAWLAVAVLVVVMALIEVVLLAGPAFAVGARRQSRSLALMAATGGTPAQSRRVVLAGGVVLGSLGALLGVLLGIGFGRAVLPAVQQFSDSWFGPFEVPWPHLAGIAGFGLLSALLAALVPAWLASRQDVVAVLAGRRGDRAPGLRSPILGAVLLGTGVAGAAYGARSTANGEYLIAGAAILSVLGMILLVPLVVVGLARLSRRLPLALRYAVRDAARHRTRTVPAVAAVAATVAGVVALGIANASDAAQNEAAYVPSLPVGQAAIGGYGLDPGGWARLTAAAEHAVPAARVAPVTGVVEGVPSDLRGASYYLDFRAVGEPAPVLSEYSSALGASVLVDDAVLPDVVSGIDAADRTRAATMLARGGAVVFTDRAVDADRVRIRGERDTAGHSRRLAPVTVPAVFVRFTHGHPMAAAVLPSTVVEELGADSATVSLSLSGARISAQQEADLSEAVAGISSDAGLYVERGYRVEDGTAILLLVLGALGAVLMLGGTLTATFLALSDARPDLATLSAVGAAPRTRRAVAAAYALVVGLVGALLGAAVGFIPGVAITYPLTGTGWEATDARGAALPDHFLVVPWLLIGSLVVALPLLTALVVGLTARSRLPLVARLD